MWRRVCFRLRGAPLSLDSHGTPVSAAARTAHFWPYARPTSIAVSRLQHAEWCANVAFVSDAPGGDQDP